MPKNTNVAIVGFGITGAALAMLLSRRGVNVHLFEQAPNVGPVGAGILLQPAGQQVLTAMGLLENVLRQAERITEVRVRTHRGHQLVRLRYDEWEAGQCAYGLHRGRLFEVLRQALPQRAVPFISARASCTIKAVTKAQCCWMRRAMSTGYLSGSSVVMGAIRFCCKTVAC